jgi:hypothetical protein
LEGSRAEIPPLSGDQNINRQDNERPGNAVTYHLQGWDQVQELPVNWEEPPQRIRADAIENSFSIHVLPLTYYFVIFGCTYFTGSIV